MASSYRRISAQLNTKIKGSDANIQLTGLFERTVNRGLGNKAQNFGANTQIDNALTNLKNEIAQVSQDGTVTLADAQTLKRASGHYGAWLYGAPDPESTARHKVYSAFYNELKKGDRDRRAGRREGHQQAALRADPCHERAHPAHPSRRAQVKSRDALMDAAYEDDIHVDDRTIDSHVKRLRKKFKAVDDAFDMIDTLYGVGYRFKDA